MINENFMKQAIALAQKALGYTAPNPLVGAVIVKDNKIIGEGYHHKAGQPHAERMALADCKESPVGATLYVTLEPCCHQGRTPPCTEAIIEAGISHVVIGSSDPNPLVKGKGAEILRKNGILVTEHFLQGECDALNPVFFHYITTKMPYVALKYAMTADGKIATTTGASRWISNETSRHYAHSLRHQYSSILVGIGTVLQDDPLLNCRLEHATQPLRVICDSNLRIPLESKICKTGKTHSTVIAYAQGSHEKKKALEALGLTLWQLPKENGQVSLPNLIKKLGENGIDSVLAEGGGTIHYSLLEGNLAQKLYVYLAPKIFGGQDAKTPVGGKGILEPKDAFTLKLLNSQELNGDILIEYEIEPKGGAVCLQD
ncbi:bifunctional diaminohydroxyphosphoribosylaminopyrimidine deaminase/5-amino-6-(5-phosphoribosylamino)uracil reductase RibD [Anaerotignum sp. MB30-C6]|uniref:bifunctional diaminohydroxyphosphoribosylaminopyrimidine deaminase/5-amino-6-(5-phosphoribosylamino)uracil reductase RibD n=1 Tax=Anaerotignum sp. MB30-C6 TaxID=3070814 RepID=UPI0027DAE998|nr:bifunctional diaminohydroxyphosphoribosylaminopyrimidine deaminase/5-amino-6-(5-phosphoribosylamino)uracil reductase RibD [Anaerotignum sp. MB30-C6]WMI80858.1 bifunctional diaminohydroxyphosphoribosylaminopyrimidine deaminase/5-amino-6-(5-phosphoribosylamino)uracil reductase RibD [Anaerotignum sp. MB30-C6]